MRQTKTAVLNMPKELKEVMDKALKNQENNI